MTITEQLADLEARAKQVIVAREKLAHSEVGELVCSPEQILALVAALRTLKERAEQIHPAYRSELQFSANEILAVLAEHFGVEEK